MNVIIFGATGVAGSGVLMECLDHPEIARVTIVTRRNTGIRHGKLVEIIHTDYKDYSLIEDHLRNQDACFYCIGVSQTQVRNEEKYNEITYEFTMAAARVLSRINREIVFCFLSGAGTDPTMKSPMMWARVKGKSEIDLARFPFRNLYIFRPGMIHSASPVKSRIWAYRMFKWLYPFMNILTPSLVTTNRELGQAMINATLGLSVKKIHTNLDIRTLSRKKIREK